jgi:hypothetical protein
MKPKKESYFWTSYSDLMTSLFFVMLVLFVLVIVLLHKRMEATEQQLNAIKEVVNSTKELQNSSFFSYRDAYKKYILNIKCQFPVNGYDIDMLSKSTQDSLKAAGNVIIDFLEKHRDTQYRWVLIISFFELFVPPEPFMWNTTHFIYCKFNINLS